MSRYGGIKPKDPPVVDLSSENPENLNNFQES
jgi:hypothetical protein